MDHKLSVLVQVDLHGAYVRLVVTGCVTEANQHVLHPVVARARTLIPPVAVSVDLTGADHVEAGAVELLRWAVEHDATARGTGPGRSWSPLDYLITGLSWPGSPGGRPECGGQHDSAHHDHISMVLAADEEFPGALDELARVELHVLHHRICCQRDQEYLTGPIGAHPTTLDRHQDLITELCRRQRFSIPALPHR